MNIAVVTGVSSGIGNAIAKSLLKQKFKVYGISRQDPKIADSSFSWFRIDLTNTKDLDSLNTRIKEDYVDLLVNNAGTAIRVAGLEFPQNNFDKTFNLNFRAPILVAGKLIKKLKGGLVINTSSLSDRIPGEGFALYCASKAALDMYFDVIALEHKEIKVINLLPDYVDTPLLRSLEDDSFNWKEAIKPKQIVKLVIKIAQDSVKIESGSRIAVINNALKESLDYKEKLWIYNTDEKSLTKLS